MLIISSIPQSPAPNIWSRNGSNIRFPRLRTSRRYQHYNTTTHSTHYHPPSSTPSPDHVCSAVNCGQNIGDSIAELRHPSTLSSPNLLHTSTRLLLLLHPLHHFRRNSPWNVSPSRARSSRGDTIRNVCGSVTQSRL